MPAWRDPCNSPWVGGVGGDSRVGQAKMPAKLMRPWRSARGGAWRRSSTCTLATKAARTTMLRWVMRPGGFSQKARRIFQRRSRRRLWSIGALILAVVLNHNVKEFDKLFFIMRRHGVSNVSSAAHDEVRQYLGSIYRFPPGVSLEIISHLKISNGPEHFLDFLPLFEVFTFFARAASPQTALISPVITKTRDPMRHIYASFEEKT